MKPWKNMRTVLLAGALLLCVLLLSACSTEGGEDPAPEDPEDPEVTTLIYAQVSDNGVDRSAVSKFNRTHKDVQIEVRSYSVLSENGVGGIDLLLTELAAGKFPDIIDLGTDGQTCQLPYRRLAEEGYLEDLWPWIENDPDLGRKKVMEAPLKAAEVNGGLYTMFESVYLHTLIGAESVVGDRASWTMEDLMDAFATMPEDAVIMDNVRTGSADPIPDMKDYLLSCLMGCFIDSFLDWETGECSFDSRQFRSCLEFVSQMPEEYDWWDDCKTLDDVTEALFNRIRSKQVMLEQLGFSRLYHMKEFEFSFGEPAVLIGYPVEDGSVGAYFEPRGIKLAMSSSCRDKEAAWEFMRQLLFPKQAKAGSVAFYDGIPVSKGGFNQDRKASREIKSVFVGSTPVPVDPLTTEEWQELEDYFNSVTRCSLFLETDVLNIVREEASVYFAGDRTLEQTVDLIQRRVSLFVNERM